MSKQELKTDDIFQIKVYQAVPFDKSQCTYFSAVGTNGKKNLDLKIEADLNMVRIKSSSDEILIPFANVACIHMNSKKRKETAANNKKTLEATTTTKASEIKRPR